MKVFWIHLIDIGYVPGTLFRDVSQGHIDVNQTFACFYPVLSNSWPHRDTPEVARTKVCPVLIC